MSYLNKSEDFKRSLFKTISEDIDNNKCYKLNMLTWISCNIYFTLNEKSLIGSWIDKYGLLSVEDAIWKIYNKYQTEDILNKIKQQYKESRGVK